MNKVRKRRSGVSSLKESLPMHVALTDSHDRSMTVHAPITSMRISCTSPCCANNSAMRQSGDTEFVSRRNDGSVAQQEWLTTPGSGARGSQLSKTCGSDGPVRDRVRQQIDRPP